jgi:hypothetical protein
MMQIDTAIFHFFILKFEIPTTHPGIALKKICEIVKKETKLKHSLNIF